VDDRGYNDYRLWGKWCQQEVFFVTRAKKNAQFEIWERRPCPKDTRVLADDIIHLLSKKAEEACPEYLRRILWHDEERNETFECHDVAAAKKCHVLLLITE